MTRFPIVIPALAAALALLPGCATALDGIADD